jgi:BirA family biotin operon repressor/biotin-[acetyl-CoA-carboxylase] ligase
MNKDCQVKLLTSINSIEFFRKHRYKHVAVTGSTNDDLKQAAANDSLCEILQADFQKAGRGRFSRKWNASPGKALLFSFSFAGLDKNFPVSLIAGISIIEAIAAFAANDLWLKWPNDVFFNKSKLAGILVENLYCANRLVQIVGIGINLEKSKEIENAIALNDIGLKVSADALMLKILERFSELVTKSDKELVKSFYKYSAPLWKNWFLLKQPDKELKVKPEALNENGSLKVKSLNNHRFVVNSGSLITLKKNCC